MPKTLEHPLKVSASPSPRRAPRGAWLAAIGLVATLSAPGCSSSAKAEKAEAASSGRPVSVVRAEVTELRREVEAVGTLAARDQTVISAEVDGRVAKVPADMGDNVRAGAPLVVLDAERFRYRASEQQAALEQTRARLAGGSTELPPPGRTPDVLSAAAKMTEAEQQLARARQLAAKNLISAQDLERAQTQLETARAAHEAAIAAERDMRAQLTGREAAFNRARRDLQDTVIRAPFDGVVAERLVSPGQLVRVETPVMRIVKLDPLRLTAAVPERFGPAIRVGQLIAVRTDALPDRAVDGKITRISPDVNLQSRAFAIEADIPNPDGLLKPGTFSRVRIATDRVDRILAVPVSAVQTRYGANLVFVVRDGALKGMPVKLGDRLGSKVEITEGLEPGSTIVSEDVEGLHEGEKVATKKAGSEGNGATATDQAGAKPRSRK